MSQKTSTEEEYRVFTFPKDPTNKQREYEHLLINFEDYILDELAYNGPGMYHHALDYFVFCNEEIERLRKALEYYRDKPDITGRYVAREALDE